MEWHSYLAQWRRSKEKPEKDKEMMRRVGGRVEVVKGGRESNENEEESRQRMEEEEEERERKVIEMKNEW